MPEGTEALMNTSEESASVTTVAKVGVEIKNISSVSK